MNTDNIAMLIGDKTGPAIIAHTYGDVRPDHLMRQAQRIRLTAKQSSPPAEGACSIECSIKVPGISASLTVASMEAANTREGLAVNGVACITGQLAGTP